MKQRHSFQRGYLIAKGQRKYRNFLIIITYDLIFRILYKSQHHLVCVNSSSSSIVIVLIGVMLLLSTVVVQSQFVDARKQNKINDEDTKQSETENGASPQHQQVSQKMKCTSDAVCLAKAINILCMKNSLCYIGYNAPFLFSTPHS